MQNQDFRIQYDSLHRLFLLPRPNSSQTIVAISLDPPIRKGNTYYPFIICQFSNDEERTLELDISDEALKAKNDAVSPYTMRLCSPLASFWQYFDVASSSHSALHPNLTLLHLCSAPHSTP